MEEALLRLGSGALRRVVAERDIVRTYRRVRWSAPVTRSLERAEAVFSWVSGVVYPCGPGRGQAGSINGNPLSVSNSIRSCST
jgi:hypothetical protein